MTCLSPHECKAKTPGRLCRSCRMKALHADPEFAAANRERMKALHADPEFAAARRERMKALNADPEFAAARRERMKARMAWLPNEWRQEYARLRGVVGAKEARRMVEDEISRGRAAPISVLEVTP